MKKMFIVVGLLFSITYAQYNQPFVPTMGCDHKCMEHKSVGKNKEKKYMGKYYNRPFIETMDKNCQAMKIDYDKSKWANVKPFIIKN